MLPEMGCVNYTVRNPVGVAALISPWNLPLYLLTFKIAPAIASGKAFQDSATPLVKISVK